MNIRSIPDLLITGVKARFSDQGESDAGTLSVSAASQELLFNGRPSFKLPLSSLLSKFGFCDGELLLSRDESSPYLRDLLAALREALRAIGVRPLIGSGSGRSGGSPPSCPSSGSGAS